MIRTGLMVLLLTLPVFRHSPASARTKPLSAGPFSLDPTTGNVKVKGASVGKLRLPPGTHKLTQAKLDARGHGLLHLRVTTAGRPGASELVVGADGSVIFSGRTGPQGVDGEWSRHLQLSSTGVVVFQRREGVTRCDDKPVYLFPQMYDFKAKRFRPVAAVPPVAGIPTLSPSRGLTGMPVGPPLNTFRLVAASTHRGDDGRAINLGPPAEAEDGKPETAWSESLGGAGQGEFLTARRPPSPHRLKALSIIPGDATSAKAFRDSNRLKRALLILSPKERYLISFAKDPLQTPGKIQDPFWVLLPRPSAATCASLVIESVYSGRGRRGQGQGRTAIAELRFYSELEFSGGLQRVVQDLGATDQKRGDTAVRILSRLGKRGVELAAKAISSEIAPPRLLVRALRVLVTSRLPEAAAPLARLAPRLQSGRRKEALEAMVGLGPAAVPHLLPLLERDDEPLMRADAARALGRIGGQAARTALLAQAGKGPEELRRAVAAGLVSLPGSDNLDAILEAAESAADSRRTADLVLVVGRRGSAKAAGQISTPRHRLRPSRRIAALWPRSKASFELRYRIIAALGRLNPKGQVRLLLRAAQDKDSVLRWIAVEQVRRVQGDTVTAWLRRFLRDKDPRVRTSAALALGKRPRSDANGKSLAHRLDRERWPMVARALAEGLGKHCVSAGNKALRRRLSIGPRGVDVRALLSLASCKPPNFNAELLAMAGDRKWRTPVRSRALELLTPAYLRARVKDVVRLFVELRTDAARSDDAEALAVATTKVLAMTNTEAAADALADALALDPHESIRAASAAGLGRMCKRSSRATLQRARQDAAKIVQGTAKRAYKRCRF